MLYRDGYQDVSPMHAVGIFLLTASIHSCILPNSLVPRPSSRSWKKNMGEEDLVKFITWQLREIYRMWVFLTYHLCILNMPTWLTNNCTASGEGYCGSIAGAWHKQQCKLQWVWFSYHPYSIKSSCDKITRPSSRWLLRVRSQRASREG